MTKKFKKVCKVSELPLHRGRRFEIDEENEVAVFRIGDEIFAVDNVCPHNHSPEIYNGYVEEGFVSCPVHGFSFSLETGLQHNGFGCKLRTFEIMIDDGFLFVEIPEERRFDFSSEVYD